MIDPFRTQYRPLNADEAHVIARIKAMASDLWAVKSVTG